MNYEKNAQRIYASSFEIIELEADLSSFEELDRLIVRRMIHACGCVQIAGDVEISSHAFAAGYKALLGGADIICDVTMVQRGIIKKALPKDNKVICGLSEAADLAVKIQNTRSAAAIELLKDQLLGAIIVIGNAPTALFHLIEGITERGWPKPALIIGAPVGFVGAVESKQALSKAPLDVPFITLHGRMGGSAIAAAAFNAIALNASNTGQDLEATK